MTILYLAIAVSLLGLIFAAFLTFRILRQDQGNETIQFIGRAIQEGSIAFLSREYRMLSIFVVLVFIILATLIDYDLLNKIYSEERNNLFQKNNIKYRLHRMGKMHLYKTDKLIMRQGRPLEGNLKNLISYQLVS